MLPLNFHKTFIPERRLIAALLEYAALNKQGDYQIFLRKPEYRWVNLAVGTSYT